MPFIVQLILQIILALPSIWKTVREIWGLIKVLPPEQQPAYKERMMKIITDAKAKRAVSSQQTEDLETMLNELKGMK